MPVAPLPFNPPYRFPETEDKRLRDQLYRNFEEATRYLNGAYAGPVFVATSTTRPLKPYAGMVIYETDTNLLLVWTGTEWRRIAPPAVSVGIANMAPGSTTSTTFVDAPGPFDVAFTKKSASTFVDAQVSGSGFVTGAIGSVIYALRINGVDYGVTSMYFNALSTHASFTGSMAPLGGLAAGAYTARLRWRVNSAPVVANVDANDLVSVRIQEITGT
jgi:hypothetical protein